MNIQRKCFNMEQFLMLVGQERKPEESVCSLEHQKTVFICF